MAAVVAEGGFVCDVCLGEYAHDQGKLEGEGHDEGEGEEGVDVGVEGDEVGDGGADLVGGEEAVGEGEYEEVGGEEAEEHHEGAAGEELEGGAFFVFVEGGADEVVGAPEDDGGDG